MNRPINWLGVLLGVPFFAVGITAGIETLQQKTGVHHDYWFMGAFALFAWAFILKDIRREEREPPVV